MVAPYVVGCATLEIRLSKIKLAFFASACRFQSAKHFSKRAELRNGREVLPGTPGRRHGISAIEAADRTSDHEPTIHWLVSRTSAACREGSRKHLSPSAMRSEPVGRIPGDEVVLRLAGITCPLINSEQKRKNGKVFSSATAMSIDFTLYLSGRKIILNFFQRVAKSAFRNACFPPVFVVQISQCYLCARVAESASYALNSGMYALLIQ